MDIFIFHRLDGLCKLHALETKYASDFTCLAVNALLSDLIQVWFTQTIFSFYTWPFGNLFEHVDSESMFGVTLYKKSVQV